MLEKRFVRPSFFFLLFFGSDLCSLQQPPGPRDRSLVKLKKTSSCNAHPWPHRLVRVERHHRQFIILLLNLVTVHIRVVQELDWKPCVFENKAFKESKVSWQFCEAFRCWRVPRNFPRNGLVRLCTVGSESSNGCYGTRIFCQGLVLRDRLWASQEENVDANKHTQLVLHACKSWARTSRLKSKFHSNQPNKFHSNSNKFHSNLSSTYLGSTWPCSSSVCN